MVLVNCPGCNKQFESGRSLSAHKRGPCGVAAKVVGKKRRKKTKKKTTKISREDDMTEEAHNETRGGLREEVNSFEAEDHAEIGAKRKLRRETVSRFQVFLCDIY